MSHVAHMNASCHTYEFVMSYVWNSRVTHMSHRSRSLPSAPQPSVCILICGDTLQHAIAPQVSVCIPSPCILICGVTLQDSCSISPHKSIHMWRYPKRLWSLAKSCSDGDGADEDFPKSSDGADGIVCATWLVHMGFMSHIGVHDVPRMKVLQSLAACCSVSPHMSIHTEGCGIGTNKEYHDSFIRGTSCTATWDMKPIWTSHVAHTSASYRTCEYVMSHMWIMSHV